MYRHCVLNNFVDVMFKCYEVIFISFFFVFSREHDLLWMPARYICIPAFANQYDVSISFLS